MGYTPTNIRKAPSTNSEIITTLSSTQEVVVISEDNDWYEIKLNDGSSGFVASWLTKEVSADTTNAKEVLEDTSTTHLAK